MTAHAVWVILATHQQHDQIPNIELSSYRPPIPVLLPVRGVATSSKDEICLLVTATKGLYGSQEDKWGVVVVAAMIWWWFIFFIFYAAELEKKFLVSILLANDCSNFEIE